MRAEFEKQRGVLRVVESGLYLAAELLAAQVRGDLLPDGAPTVDASDLEWADWLTLNGGLRLAGVDPFAAAPGQEVLFDAA